MMITNATQLKSKLDDRKELQHMLDVLYSNDGIIRSDLVDATRHQCRDVISKSLIDLEQELDDAIGAYVRACTQQYADGMISSIELLTALDWGNVAKNLAIPK